MTPQPTPSEEMDIAERAYFGTGKRPIDMTASTIIECFAAVLTTASQQGYQRGMEEAKKILEAQLLLLWIPDSDGKVSHAPTTPS